MWQVTGGEGGRKVGQSDAIDSLGAWQSCQDSVPRVVSIPKL